MTDTEKTLVRVVLPFPENSICAQHMLLEPMGFAADEGIEVTVDFVDSPLDATASVAAGTHDVTEVNTLFAFVRREKDIPVKAFASLCRAPYRSFAVPENSPITTLEQLSGRTIGTDHHDLVGLAGPVLREAGIDPVDGVTWVTDYLRDVVPTLDDVELLRGGKLDAIWVLSDSYEMLQEHGVALRRLPTATLENLTPSGCLYANHDALEDSRRAGIAAYGRALARATEFIAEDPEQAVRVVWENWPGARPTTIDDEDLAFRVDVAGLKGRNDLTQLQFGDVPRRGSASEREISAWEAFLLKDGTVTERRDPSEYFDFTMLDEIDPVTSASV